MHVTRIDASDTHDLRRRVLRDGTASDVVVFDGDDEPATMHLAIRSSDGDIVAISTWLALACPDDPVVPAHQLRGMAIEPGLQGQGIGTLLLAAGIDRCAALGDGVVWAHARSTALDFYLRRGFTTYGDEYVDPTTGLAHIDVRFDVAPGDAG